MRNPSKKIDHGTAGMSIDRFRKKTESQNHETQKLLPCVRSHPSTFGTHPHYPGPALKYQKTDSAPTSSNHKNWYQVPTRNNEMDQPTSNHISEYIFPGHKLQLTIKQDNDAEGSRSEDSIEPISIFK